LQAQIIRETGVTSIRASTAFFLALGDPVVETFGRDAWTVKSAFPGGEMGDWKAKRRRIETDYGRKTWAAYATADLGLVGMRTVAMGIWFTLTGSCRYVTQKPAHHWRMAKRARSA